MSQLYSLSNQIETKTPMVNKLKTLLISESTSRSGGGSISSIIIIVCSGDVFLFIICFIIIIDITFNIAVEYEVSQFTFDICVVSKCHKYHKQCNHYSNSNWQTKTGFYYYYYCLCLLVFVIFSFFHNCFCYFSNLVSPLL